MQTAMIGQTMDRQIAQAPKQKTYLAVQALRGVAASMVVIHHSSALWLLDFGPKNVYGPRQGFWENGASGVDIFFIISGFVMAISSFGGSSGKAPTAGNFMGRRLVRVVPLYWFLTLLTWAKETLSALRPSVGSAPHGFVSIGYLISSLLFLPHAGPDGVIQPLVGPGWTLSYEMFFYLLFAAALAFKIAPIRFLTPLLILLAAIGALRGPGWHPVTTLLDPFLLEFLAGVWLAYAAKNRFTIPPWLSAALGLIGFAVIFFIPQGEFYGSRTLAWGIPALLIVQAAIFLEPQLNPRIPRWMLEVGDASYSLYLGHILIIAAVARLLISTHIATRQTTMTLLCLAVALPLSILVYRLVERPLTLAIGRATGWGAPRTLVADTDHSLLKKTV
ncbi:acyltransferase [Granulicella sp. S190]|uniref:acyltransferase family protein n=1 Tax=Granulicella sp. S190 TaxID=1747226 RepID=UPI00131CD77F|nr:acyltransferase [Granulicella sp. S190]